MGDRGPVPDGTTTYAPTEWCLVVRTDDDRSEAAEFMARRAWERMRMEARVPGISVVARAWAAQMAGNALAQAAVPGGQPEPANARQLTMFQGAV